MELENTKKNDSKNIENLRKNYLNAQIKYVEALKKDSHYNKVFDMVKGKHSDSALLWYEAFDRLVDIEDGKVRLDELNKKEKEITIIMAAIENWIIKKENSKSEKDNDDLQK